MTGVQTCALPISMLIWPDSDQFISLLHSASFLLIALIQAVTLSLCVVITSVSSINTTLLVHKLRNSHFTAVLNSTIPYALLPSNARTST